MNDPPLLLADEPTGNLDSATTTDVLGLLKRFHATGRTIVVVTHDPRVATAAQRVVTLRDGQVVDETRLSGGTGKPVTLEGLIQS
jgi:putative ABC transport system ATP-binding protein